MSIYADKAVSGYLDRLRRVGATLPSAAFADTWQAVTEHLEEAAGRGEHPDQALARLGSPEAIVAAAAEQSTVDEPAAATQTIDRRSTLSTPVTLFLLAAGVLLCAFGWIVGVVRLWWSDQWKFWEKAAATVVLPVAYIAARYGPLDTSSGVAAATALVANSITVGYLAVVARPHRGGY